MLSTGVVNGVCRLFAQSFSPGPVVPAYAKRVDLWASELRDKTIGTQSDLSRVQIFGDFFAKQLGFRGNSENYYDLKNALLPFVIDARRGIPSSLSLVYIFAAARAGCSFLGGDW